VAWGFLSSLQRDCRACGGGVLLVGVWSSWGKRERERERVKKQIQKPSSPAAHPREKEEQCRSKRHHFRLLLFFFMGTQKWVTTILFVLTLNIVVK
jgi:hypothetical protein